MASDVLPDPDTPTTATVRHSHVDVDILQVVVPGPAHADDRGQGSRHGNITSLHTRQPTAIRQRMPRQVRAGAGTYRPRVRSVQGWTGPLGPRSRRSDCMMANVVVVVKTSMSAAASTPAYFAMMGAAARSVTVSRWALTPAQTFSPYLM